MLSQVYISFSEPSEQVIALRLQALGTASGLSVIVPPLFTRQPDAALLGSDSSSNVDFAQLVIGVALNSISSGFLRDLERARLMGRQTIIFSGPITTSALRSSFPFATVIEVNPATPNMAEMQISSALGLSFGAERTLLMGFALLAVGIILMDSLSPRQKK